MPELSSDIKVEKVVVIVVIAPREEGFGREFYFTGCFTAVKGPATSLRNRDQARNPRDGGQQEGESANPRVARPTL